MPAQMMKPARPTNSNTLTSESPSTHESLAETATKTAAPSGSGPSEVSTPLSPTVVPNNEDSPTKAPTVHPTAHPTPFPTVKPTAVSSIAPSSAEKQLRRQRVQEYLTSNGISSRRDLESESTPQYLATDWIAHEDELRLEIPEANSEADSFVQRYVLAVLYYALGGPNWKMTMDFLIEKSECSWFDFTGADDRFDPDSMLGVNCNANKIVNSITIRKLCVRVCLALLFDRE